MKTLKYYLPILALMISVAGCKQINQLSESVGGLFDTPDEKLVRAFIKSDAENIDKILNSDESGDMLTRLRTFESTIKVRSFEDLKRAWCTTQSLCNRDNIDACTNSVLSVHQAELRAHPNCSEKIIEFEVVSTLCTLRSNICIGDNPLMANRAEYQEESNHLNRNLSECMQAHLKDMSAKLTCIQNDSNFSQADLDVKIENYCAQAVSCNAYASSKPCIDKYKQFHDHDKYKEYDCTNRHLTYSMFEFQLLNAILNTAEEKKSIRHLIKDKDYKPCDIINDYEASTHPEELFDTSQTAAEYNTKFSASTRNATDFVLSGFLTTIRNDEFNNLLIDYRKSMGEYTLCKWDILRSK